MKTKLLFPLFATLAFSHCAANPRGTTKLPITTGVNQNNIAASLMNFKVTFKSADYYTARSPQYLANCAGGAKNYYDALKIDASSGLPAIFPASEFDATITLKPSFIKDVSVDLTYANSVDSANISYACSYGTATGVPIPSNCASFDTQEVSPPAAIGYGKGYYLMLNSYLTADASKTPLCYGQGPIASGPQSALLSGGVYFDLDRSALGPNENLLLHITSIPLKYSNAAPASLTFSAADNALFNVHLMRTQLPPNSLASSLQPRFLTYSAQTVYPQIARKIAVFAPASGQIREEQILIPLSEDPSIDRIRIEKYSGSAILVSASLYRMGIR